MEGITEGRGDNKIGRKAWSLIVGTVSNRLAQSFNAIMLTLSVEPASGFSF